MPISDIFTHDDHRTVAVALISILLSVFIGIPSLIPIFRCMGSNIRLQLLLRNGTDGKNGGDGDNTSSATDISISGLFVHPVKSMRAISVSESSIDRKGLTNDRRFMVVYELPLPIYKKEWGPGDTTHRFLTQRQCPSLATISAAITTTGNGSETERILVLERKLSSSLKNDDEPVASTSTSTIRIPLAIQKQPPKSFLAGLWDDVVAVDDIGHDAASFLQKIVDADEELSASTEGGSKKNVRLVCESPKKTWRDLPAPTELDNRSYVPDYAKTWKGGALGKPSLTDGFPILIASEASLDALNQKLVEDGKEAIPMSRFRPNIVVRGKSLKPFEEDRWKVVAIGNVVFAIVKACPRCKQSCTNQVTGEVSPQMEPVETMKSFRRASGNGPENGAVFFAQNAIPIGTLEGKTLLVGDSVRVLERGDPVYID